VPHPACPHCFTYACPDCYTIVEEVPGTGIILARQLPNPAPQLPEGVRMHDNAGRPIWYIGRQPYVGPTDEEPVSPELPLSLIALKRIHARHHQEIFSIPGVHGFGIGAKGFVVYLDPTRKDSASRIPTALEGAPVTVEVGGPFVLLGGAGADLPSQSKTGQHPPEPGRSYQDLSFSSCLAGVGCDKSSRPYHLELAA
jgi:hypothetical protein